MKVFISRPIPKVGIDMLKAKGWDVVVNEKAEGRAATKAELIEGAKSSDAILAVLTDKIDGEVMDVGTPALKIIANYAVGFDNIDLEAAKQRKIMVTNTPGVLTNTVAEHTFTLMLSIAHRISEADRFSRAGRYHAWGPNLLLGTDLSGKTLGVVGLGRIGSRVAFHAVKGFEMKVLYNDPKPNSDFEKEFGAQYVERIDDMLPHCDFVSIHVPLLDSTHHLINEARLKIMKRSAYLINTSRGPIIDEKALALSLSKGWIRGAAIDVFEFEPEIVPELKELDNVILTPHIASATGETRNKMAEMAAQNIIEALGGRTPPNLVK
ncbi:MAG: hypothetical protein A3B91_01130 [Candidatus Yanofskybacteria bacterium RIFCSPHIGHO2_02_FULL_41_29]|uniref:D-glycerate dehydrogenase n=1 Tax=Candidatus Yanofskybacteria bacterium RIFCSPHIGHO2_01_FULL_41_53 TaxID=1802663 RepID=A0A1F8EEZ3_9BACT|nr:MAG: hypothetical protein A2650_01375 [Candidatus Yanofskybacteria bacterium RIFCSPHIGHO2_01_FULL_41_53]OGN11365.1 MAG: hypothetical protein A3B91_01130 [Candidatus Yanofskybacteria bacterium RIFCSPHIGHO2_02_FULL_41_29]OGN17735.1 MAG: hypothetical protein A3F48_00670 [Candidatus Yanofskybacteria bacterium RIFCSPHIGHO2_12_FULL_41_9]OGN24735.1 MAG: hypothetical protein A2916_01730 [Candidatus Yanofskybacteria bacterium RIFCSPLOWO2_01_FULL_41_67]OGN28932.1 MAG: hypothetical protein A3H54_02200 